MSQPKVRNWVAVSAQMRNSAGSMDFGKKRRNKKDRRNTKQTLRKEY